MMTLDWTDLDLYYSKVKFGPLGFGMEKTETVHFSFAVVPSNIKMHSHSTPLKFWKSKAFSGLRQRSRVHHLSTFSISLQSHMQPPDNVIVQILIMMFPSGTYP